MTILIAAAAGVLNTLQSGANASLNKALGQPILAALILAATNVVVYLSAAPFVGLAWRSGRFSNVPRWAWLGGALRATYVLALIFLAEQLGAAIFTDITVTAAIVASVILDHYGWVGFAQHTAAPWRILGSLPMVGGVVLISIF